MKFHIEHTFREISLPDFEKLFFEEVFNQALCAAVKLERRLEKLDNDGQKLVRVVRVIPDREIPGPVAKIVGQARIEYTEHMQYSWGSNQATWHTVSSILPDKVDTRGTIRFAKDAGGVRRTVDGDVAVKIFGVGGIIERFVVADIERSYADAAAFTQRWISTGGKA